ncbi:VIT family protein [Caballeronia terrestris]|uniref:VIT family protein n=2 Tax=Caballeronia TaxID=1827195 RepID=A0A158KSY7_9BURK|nr:VIT family protein [Caballeronia humi]SAL84248.1 VIT family protein [Caballeronia terrestris]
MAMAAGKYVSVSSQADTEQADLAREHVELSTGHAREHAERAAIYVQRGVEEALADQVATQLMAKDALAAHARDELGISEAVSARPLQAALASALAFTIGAALPLLVALLSVSGWLIGAVSIASLAFLAVLGALAAYTGGASTIKGMWRVSFWGLLAMAITAAVGLLFGAVAEARSGSTTTVPEYREAHIRSLPLQRRSVPQFLDDYQQAPAVMAQCWIRFDRHRYRNHADLPDRTPRRCLIH